MTVSTWEEEHLPAFLRLVRCTRGFYHFAKKLQDRIIKIGLALTGSVEVSKAAGAGVRQDHGPCQLRGRGGHKDLLSEVLCPRMPLITPSGLEP